MPLHILSRIRRWWWAPDGQLVIEGDALDDRDPDDPVSDHHHWWCLVDDGRPRPRCRCFDQECRDRARCAGDGS